MTDKLKRKLNNTFISDKMNSKYKLNKPKYNIRLYFANWCPHCVSFKPIWYKLKTKYNDIINFTEIDCTSNNPDLSFVSSFPTITIHDVTGKYIKKYNDQRTMKKLENFIMTLNS
jgi:thiol-disulfide isomerase/thioredoxin